MRVMSSKLNLSLVLSIFIMLYWFFYYLIIFFILASLLVIFFTFQIFHYLISRTFIEALNFRSFPLKLSIIFIVASINTFGPTSIQFARLTQV